METYLGNGNLGEYQSERFVERDGEGLEAAGGGEDYGEGAVYGHHPLAHPCIHERLKTLALSSDRQTEHFWNLKTRRYQLWRRKNRKSSLLPAWDKNRKKVFVWMVHQLRHVSFVSFLGGEFRGGSGTTVSADRIRPND